MDRSFNALSFLYEKSFMAKMGSGFVTDNKKCLLMNLGMHFTPPSYHMMYFYLFNVIYIQHLVVRGISAYPD